MDITDTTTGSVFPEVFRIALGNRPRSLPQFMILYVFSSDVLYGTGGREVAALLVIARQCS